MRITKRQVSILKCLNEYPNITLKMISNRLNVSIQTVKTELQNLTELLASFEIFIEVSHGNKLDINGIENITKMIKSTETLLEFSLENQILLVLVLNEDFIIFQEIADNLFVSKSLIEKQMVALLKKYSAELQSVRHCGVRYISSLMERGQLFVKLVETYICGLDFKVELNQFHENHFSIMNYFNNDQIEKVLKQLNLFSIEVILVLLMNLLNNYFYTCYFLFTIMS